MDISRELLFFFSLLGAFNGLLLAAYFFLRKNGDSISNNYLGLLLLVLSIRIGKSVFFYFNRDLSAIYIHIGIIACLAIGPLLWLYLKSATQPGNKIKSGSLLHFIPLLIVAVFSYFMPYTEYRPLWIQLIHIIYIQWMVYILLSFYQLRSIIQQILAKKEKRHPDSVWLLSILFGITLIWIAYFTNGYTSYIVGALSFSFVIYLLIMVIVLNKIGMKNDGMIKEKYAASRIHEDEAQTILKKVRHIMETEKPYKNPNLTMPELAKSLNITPHHLSQFINNNLGKNFSQFVNNYRIKEAATLLEATDHITIESIAYESGFNSLSTFYTAFKKERGMTPAVYKSNLA